MKRLFFLEGTPEPGNSNASSQIPCCWRKLMRKNQSESSGNAAGRQGEARLGAGCSQDEDMECCLCPRQLGGPGRCQPGVPSAELLLGNDTWDGLGPPPTWKLLSAVMRLVWECSYTAPGNAPSPHGCRSWTQCHLWVPSSSGSPTIPCSVTILGSSSHQTIPVGVVWK